MTTLLSPPVLSGPAAARNAVSAAAEQPLWTLTDKELAAEVADALALKAQAEALLLARLGEAEARDVARTRGATSMTAWLRGSHRVGPGEASRLVRTARALREQLPATAAAIAAGEVHLGQVEVIVDSLKDLSEDVGAVQRAEGETLLIDSCASLDPIGLGRLGRRLEELLDPDGVQARDEAKIRDHEERAYAKRELTLSPDPYGSAGTIRGRYDADGAAIIAAALDALAAPWPQTPDGDKDTRSPAARRYDALLEVFRRQLHHPATSSGDGGKAQIRVTIPLMSLTDRVGYGLLDDGTQISPTLARMLACDAALIPAVLNGHGQPLDLGRERRLFTGPARTGIEIRDGGCVWPGCPRPASWCQIHHLIPWWAGGRTDQTNGGLFCTHHHRQIEQGEWQAIHHRGRIWLQPPTRLDPHRTPRINTTTDHPHPHATGHPAHSDCRRLEPRGGPRPGNGVAESHSVLIRDIQPATDGALARELLVIQHGAYAVEARLIGDDRIPPMHETIGDLRRAPLLWLGAFIDDRLVGAVAWVDDVDELEIDRLMVAPSGHRAGVGTSLVREVLRRAGSNGTSVSTGQANTPAKALYVRLGFSRVGEREVLPGLWVTQYAHGVGS